MTPASAYTADQLLGIDLFADDKDDAGARLPSRRMVTTRKQHTCLFAERHDILVGSRARVEKALMFNKWVSFYVCATCLAGFLDEVHG